MIGVDSRARVARWPAGAVPAAAFGGLLVAAAFATSTRGLLDGAVRTAPIVAVVAAAAAAGSGASAFGVGLLGFAFCNGFVVDRYGELVWHGGADAIRLAAFLLLAGTSLWIARSVADRRVVAPAGGQRAHVPADRGARSGRAAGTHG